MMGRPGSVVVADGDKEARAFVAGPLRRAGYDVIEVNSGAAALEAASARDVALVVLEVSFPDMSGYDVCRELRVHAGDGLSIFFVSGEHADSAHRVAALLLGADDFIVKPVHPAEFMARVERFVTRRSALSTPGPGLPPRERLRLTVRENEVLDLLVAGMRQKEIALRLSISPKTVGTHIQNLFGKVEVHSRTQLVARAYTLGLVEVA